MNPSSVSKGGCLAGRFSRSTIDSSSALSYSSGSGTGAVLERYWRHHHQLAAEEFPLRLGLPERRIIMEIKTYEEVYTGRTVNQVKV
jgi:hypothetical protein